MSHFIAFRFETLFHLGENLFHLELIFISFRVGISFGVGISFSLVISFSGDTKSRF